MKSNKSLSNDISGPAAQNVEFKKLFVRIPKSYYDLYEYLAAASDRTLTEAVIVGAHLLKQDFIARGGSITAKLESELSNTKIQVRRRRKK